MSDDFIIEEASAEPVSRAPFLTAVAALVAIFIIAALCGGISYTMRGSGGGDEVDEERNQEIAAIEMTNAAVAITNEAVTATIAAMETEAATTPTPNTPPTNTPAPTSSPAPTNTRVLNPDVGDGTPTDGGGENTDPDGEATPIFPGDGGGASTPTPIPGLGSGGSGSSGGSGTLPETGIGMWAAVLGAAALIAVLIGARKLRTN